MHFVALGYWREAVALPEVLNLCSIDLCETIRTVGVLERESGRIHAIYPSIRTQRDPALTIRGRSGLASGQSADTTDGEHRRCDECFPHQSGLRPTSCLSAQFLKSHMPLLSFSMYLRDREQQRIDVLGPMIHSYKETQPSVEPGNP